MRNTFETMEIVRQLGVAPSTGAIITALLNNQLHPDHYKSLEPWPFQDMNCPIPVGKVMIAVCRLLELAPEKAFQTLWKGDEPLAMYIDRGIEGQPTIIYDLEARNYMIHPIEEVINQSK